MLFVAQIVNVIFVGYVDGFLSTKLTVGMLILIFSIALKKTNTFYIKMNILLHIMGGIIYSGNKNILNQDFLKLLKMTNIGEQKNVKNI